MKSFFLNGAFFALLLSMQVSHAEQFYKWTDDKGVVHYSQQPPQGKTSKAVKTHSSKGSSQASDSSNDADSTENREGKSQEQTQTAPIEKIKKDPELCEQAKKDAQMLRQKPIVRRNNKVMTLDEKNQALENLSEVVKLNC